MNIRDKQGVLKIGLDEKSSMQILREVPGKWRPRTTAGGTDSVFEITADKGWEVAHPSGRFVKIYLWAGDILCNS